MDRNSEPSPSSASSPQGDANSSASYATFSGGKGLMESAAKRRRQQPPETPPGLLSPPETPRGRRFLNLLPLTATSCESDLAPRVGRFRTAVLPLDNRFSPEGGVKSGVPVWRRGVAGGGTEPAPKSVWNTPPTASPVASLDSSLSGSQQDMSGNRKGLLLG